MSSTSDPLPVVSRCGPCTACCTVTAIDELGKPEYCDCRHLTTTGCGQYDTRPEVCRRFECMYLSDRWGERPGGEMMRPDRCGLLVYGYQESNGEEAIRVSEVSPGALEGDIAKQLITGLLQAGYAVAVHREGEQPSVLRKS